MSRRGRHDLIDDPGEGAVSEHGASELPLVFVDTYNEELRDAEGFIGDRASNRAFRAILDDLRDRIKSVDDEDPLGERPSKEISKRRLDRVLTDGDPLAAGVVLSAIEDFARELAAVTARFLRLKEWKDTQRIVIGGGLRESRVGELAIGRAAVIVKSSGHAVDLVPIRHHPDEAGLIGSVHLAPSVLLRPKTAMLAVDIGGSNIRAGVVTIPGGDLSKCAVHVSELWRYVVEDPKPSRAEAVARLVTMLERLAAAATKDGLELLPLIGVSCPGVIATDGSIERGGQNLPGNWESSRFNLVAQLKEAIPHIGERATHVLMHNDAVVQGLSEAPFMTDVARWGVLTIGTGLGNARFTNRASK
ncbi:MAG: ROK family protein [Labilithrix sp.]|nr:ROK family protein [Labilithrix sp.]